MLHHLITFYWINILKIIPLDYMFYVYYVFNTHTKFYTNRMLFTIQSQNPSYMHNFKYKILKLKHLIDSIVIDFILS